MKLLCIIGGMKCILLLQTLNKVTYYFRACVSSFQLRAKLITVKENVTCASPLKLEQS